MLATLYSMLTTSVWSDREGLFEEGGELELVQGERTDGGRSGGVAARISRLAAKNLLELRRDPGPGAHVFGFLLSPDDPGRGIFLCDFGEAFAMQRIKLLEADDGDIVELLLRAVVGQVVVNLARAQQNARNRLRTA